ncbi:hypothetical protein [Erythrobacter sp.]|uniref:hypothetical protein n=1 Tax=Erythrobacter sp. TaxID=1042 RepID=UPI001B081ABD|nr:hypothetical protein [Erythrobacter sp.]MBO6526208.1 hypothetical protein [Erythrobacter sp.]MBO6530461.1 hypothetical protein [Erythrobacter sp.]
MSVTLAAFLAAAAASLMVSLAACITVLREPGLRFKFVWAPFCFVGMGGGALVLAVPDQIYWFFGIALPTASFSTVDGSLRPELVRFLFPAGAFLAGARVYRHRAVKARDAADARASS